MGMIEKEKKSREDEESKYWMDLYLSIGLSSQGSNFYKAKDAGF